MIYFAAVLFVILLVVSGQAVLWGQCERNTSFNNDADGFRWWKWMDWSNYMRFQVVLHLL
jgi:hypothetical protein